MAKFFPKTATPPDLEISSVGDLWHGHDDQLRRRVDEGWIIIGPPIRSGDLVRLPVPETGGFFDSMVVYADYQTGLLEPACAGGAWRIPIASVEVLERMDDARHNVVLDRFANGISRGLNLPGAEKALEIHRPDAAAKIEAVHSGIFRDLARKAGIDATFKAVEVAKLGDRSMQPGIILAAGQYLVMYAAAIFAIALSDEPIEAEPDLADPRTLATWRTILGAWALLPDGTASEAFLEEGLGAISSAKVVSTRA